MEILSELDATLDATGDSLPVYSDLELIELSDAGLIQRMIADEDRVPRNVIDECVRRGATFEQLLVHEATTLDDESRGRWWLIHHCAMTLGLIPTQAAGLSLVKLIRQIDCEDNGSLREWLAGNWPALFANKPFLVAADLRAYCEDRSVGWFMRTNVIEAVLAMHDAQGEAQLSEVLAWVTNLIESPDEDFDVRCHAGCLLLDSPRPEYRQLLENLGDLQSGIEAIFLKSDVERAYAKRSINLPWGRSKDPWQFYSPDSIEARQERWAEEDARRARWALKKFDTKDDFGRRYDVSVATYVRETPKIGRNDPCHCGSGKKYKKCCLTVDSNDE